MRYLLIPSCEVAPVDQLDGTETERRLNAGLAMWKRGQFEMIIVSGGVYMPPEIQTRPSGTLMKEWLVRCGVKEHLIIAETRSRDTYENISGVMDALWGKRTGTITVISQWQHALRFWITFHRAHGVAVEIIPLRYHVGLKRFLMEWLLILIHVFDKTGTSWLVRKNKQDRTFPRPSAD